MDTTADFWRGEFGNAYTRRNQVDWRSRVPFWQNILARTHPGSILEVGCNAGWNLRAIRQVNPTPSLLGVDVNQAAIAEASDAGLPVMEASACNLAGLGSFDLVFTAGLLIHIAPDDLSNVMGGIIAASRQHVLAIEYADETEVEVNYRGHDAKLWRRPFGKLYQERGLRLISGGAAPSDAFDRCEFWLMEKQSCHEGCTL